MDNNEKGAAALERIADALEILVEHFCGEPEEDEEERLES